MEQNTLSKKEQDTLSKEEQDILSKRKEILNNPSKATLEEVSQILKHYKSSQTLEGETINMQPIIINGVAHHYKYNPQEAATLNERYRELTGHDHPVFLKEQSKVLNLLLKNKKELTKQGYLKIQIDTLKRLKANLKHSTKNINILNHSHPFTRKNDIMLNLSKATLEEVSQILEYYKSSQTLDCGTVNMQPIIIDGVAHHYKYNPQEAAALNERYRELTGHDHPVFLKEQKKVLNLLLRNKKELTKQGLKSQIDTLKRLKSNLKHNKQAIEITSGREKHILNKFYEILTNLQDADLQDITALLNYYNSKPVIIDGLSYHPFNDPIIAYKLNERYHELTNQNHPTFIKQFPIVTNKLIKDKNILLKNGIYSPEYFEKLEQIRNNFNTNLDPKPKQK